MRISDWGSDVCSSDLDVDHEVAAAAPLGARFGCAGDGADVSVHAAPGQGVERQAHGLPHLQFAAVGFQRPGADPHRAAGRDHRSEEHTSELQSLMRISYAVFCLKKTTNVNSYPVTNTS